ncbi:MAG: phosphatase [Dethiosulfatibacter sp.]|nr:phosphatase [Dethiosulfatibacter sp.]
MDKKTLEAAIREEKLKYFREWRRKNPDKVRKHNKNYWENRAKAKLGKEKKADDITQQTNNTSAKGEI